MVRGHEQTVDAGTQRALTAIQHDAILSRDPSDYQTANRLSLEVSQYMQDHRGSQDQDMLTRTLTQAGLQPAEIARLEKLGFPTVATAHLDQASVLHDVHSAEDGYHMQSWASDKSQAALKNALSEVKEFCQAHPDQANDLIKKLESRDLIGQLSIAELQEKTRGSNQETFTKEQAKNLFDSNSPLGRAFQNHFDQAFSVTPDSRHFGTGYADASLSADGRLTTGSRPGDVL